MNIGQYPLLIPFLFQNILNQIVDQSHRMGMFESFKLQVLPVFLYDIPGAKIEFIAIED
jgi:hypothetical protein